ncbi:MAG: addiction module protein [Opitutaceae bacterium]|nr:addiction module protein [Cytophagales bacterium]
MLPNEIESLNHFQKDELDDRIDHYIENPQEVYSWEDVKQRLLVSKI